MIKEKINELSKQYEYNVIIREEVKPFINNIEWIEEIKTFNGITEASLIDCKNKIILGTGPITAHEVNEYILEEGSCLDHDAGSPATHVILRGYI